MNAEAMWAAYGGQGDYNTWAFGAEPDTLAELVRTGRKTATASAYPLYAVDQEPLPRPGEYSVILDSQQNAVCVIRTTRVDIMPFSSVDARYAAMEGEGDLSLGYWRRVHEAFFTAEMERAGLAFSADMPVVMEVFEVVFPS